MRLDFAPIGAALRSAVIVLLSLLLSPTCTLDASATDLEGNKMHLDAEIIIRTPTIPSVEEGRRLIAAAADAGVSTISIAFKDDDTGMLFYDSRLPYTETYPGHEEAPVLHAVIEEAHARGLRVVAWVPIFNDPIAAKAMPEWRVGTWQGEHAVPSAQFVSPVREDVRQHQLSLLLEVVERFPVDGIRLDWVRYDTITQDLSTFAREKFKAEFGADPATLRRSDHLWPDWVEWRAGFITQFVADVVTTVPQRAGRPLDIGAYLLPFSALYGIEGSPESGQDYEALAATAITLMPMVYWQDWSSRADWEAWTDRVLGRTLRLVGDAEVVPVFSVTNRAWGSRLEHTENVQIVHKAVSLARQRGLERISFFYYEGWWDGLIDLYVRSSIHISE